MSTLVTSPTALASVSPRGGILINGRFWLPPDLGDLDTFRRWACSDERPEQGRFAFLDGILWVDLSTEQLYTHNQVKTEFTSVLHGLVRGEACGRYLTDGMLLSHPAAGLSTVPDGLFVSYAALQSGRVRQVPSVRHHGVVELEGSPEMVLEVVSDSSVEMDMVLLPPLYLAAGVDEFWRADVRGDLRFEILRRSAGGFVSAQQPDGWWHSEVFGRDFLMAQGADPLGQPVFALQVRP